MGSTVKNVPGELWLGRCEAPGGTGGARRYRGRLGRSEKRLAANEAFAFAKKFGLSMAELFDTVKGGGAHSAMMDWKNPQILSMDFSHKGSKVSVHLKTCTMQWSWQVNLT